MRNTHTHTCICSISSEWDGVHTHTHTHILYAKPWFTHPFTHNPPPSPQNMRQSTKLKWEGEKCKYACFFFGGGGNKGCATEQQLTRRNVASSPPPPTPNQRRELGESSSFVYVRYTQTNKQTDRHTINTHQHVQYAVLSVRLSVRPWRLVCVVLVCYDTFHLPVWYSRGGSAMFEFYRFIHSLQTIRYISKEREFIKNKMTFSHMKKIHVERSI